MATGAPGWQDQVVKDEAAQRPGVARRPRPIFGEERGRIAARFGIREGLAVGEQPGALHGGEHWA